MSVQPDGPEKENAEQTVRDDDEQPARKKRRVQLGFEDVEPGMTPKMKENLEPSEKRKPGVVSPSSSLSCRRRLLTMDRKTLGARDAAIPKSSAQLL